MEQNETNLIKEPFRSYKLDSEKDQEKGKIFTIRLNEQEVARLEENKKLLRQSKDGSCLKQLMQLGDEVLHDTKSQALLGIIIKNIKNNRRLGIPGMQE